MKKWISLLCVSMLVIGMITASVVSASAEEDSVSKSNTAVDVKRGDEVTYVLMLDKVAQPIIGSDFSVYYDSTIFDLESVADYNDETDPEEWTAVINTELDGEVRGVWSILKGVDFSSKRNFITLNLKAVADANDSHISYRIRFLYDNDVFNSNDHPQITTYEFTCDVLVNGEKVLESAGPEWNDKAEEENGKFVPSYDGKSEHADASIPGVVDKAKGNTGNGKAQSVENDANEENAVGGGSNNGSGNYSSGGSGGASGGGSAGGGVSGGQKAGSSVTTAPPATTAEGYYILATDADGNVTATSDEAPEVATMDSSASKGGASPVLWIIIALVVLAGGGAAVYFFMKKPSGTSAAPINADNAPAVDEAAPTTDVPAADESDDTTVVLNDGEEKTEVLNEDEEKTEVLDESDAKTEVLDEDDKTQIVDESSESDNK